MSATKCKTLITCDRDNFYSEGPQGFASTYIMPCIIPPSLTPGDIFATAYLPLSPKRRDQVSPSLSVHAVAAPFSLGSFYSTSPFFSYYYYYLHSTTLSHAFKGMNAADLQVLRLLGQGTSGRVYLVRDRKSKAKLALKVIPKKDRNEYSLNAVVKERNISSKLSDSPWFIHMCAAWHDQLHFYIAMTVYPTDLDSEIIRCGVIDPNRARFYMAEMIIALTELHSRGIIHRDIKAPNMLIDQEGHIVLADFGLSKDFHKMPSIAERVYQPYWPYLPDENPTSASVPRDPEDLHFVAWNYRGSDMEMAPEIHLRMPYSFGVDFWSASVILYWMLTGRPPFYEDEAAYEDEGEEDCKPLMYKIAEDDLYWDESDNVDEITKDFLERMMVKDPKQRLMISFDMPTHPYFAGVNWTLMEERLVTPPWIPGSDIGHVYKDISPAFSTGETYLEGEDPFPDFSFYSKQLVNDDDDDTEEEEESSSEAEEETLHTTDEDDNSSCHDLISRAVFEDEDDGKVNHDFDLMATWDISIISPPATGTKPHGPGPKSWIHGLDLVKFLSSIPQNAISLHSQHSTTTRQAWPDPTFPSSITATTTITRATTRSCPHHVVNGVGLMFKVKVWIWKIWSPKPKQEKRDRWKRLTVLS